MHLEADPNLFENDEIKFSVLKQSNQARLDIFTNLLTTTLDIEANASFNTEQSAKYTNGYFLGRHEVGCTYTIYNIATVNHTKF